ncbi:MAG TPA: chorismate-binding protein, partial [Actinopolymorphaceae bacterium]
MSRRTDGTTDLHAYATAGGVIVERSAAEVDGARLTELAADLDQRRGGVLSSGVEYPGRYSRWHLGYIDPPIELVARGRTLGVRALNDRGLVLLPALRAVLDPDHLTDRPDGFEVHVAPGEPGFPEEERSRQPTVFTPLRALTALFASEADPHLGFYGAFGYDLALQFEPLRTRLERPSDQRDLVLHLPDEIFVIDRKRETCRRYRYEFVVDGRTTAGLPRVTPPAPAARGPVRPVPESPEPGSFARIVEQAKERFRRGDLFEVTPGHVLYGACDSPAAFYERLRTHNPAPYEFFFNLGEGEHLVAASPEMYVRVTGDRVETCPIAGTIRRGADALEDSDQILRLLGSTKDEAELTMCTDVDRNDKSRVCVPGTVEVIGRRQI